MAIQAAEKKLRVVEKVLKTKPWFKRDGWQVSIHPFPRKDPNGFTFHVFKKNWFIEDSSGIHIESHLDINPKKQKKTYLTIHLLHQDTIPGTKAKRILLSKTVVDAVFEEISQWPDYQFRAGKYGQQPFTLFMDGTAVGFEAKLEREVARLCKIFGPLIDKTLAEILKN